MENNEIKSYGGKLLEDMEKEELILIVKHLGDVLKKLKKMDDKIESKILNIINNYLS